MLLSVVIPTKDRPEYLLHAVRSCTRVLDADCEVVVIENSAQSCSDVLESTGSSGPLIRVVQSDAADVAANFEKGLDEARGEFVCFIGDDDSVLPDIVPAARWCLDRRVDSLISTAMASYVWPDVRFRHFANRTSTGELILGDVGLDLRPVDLASELAEVIRRAGSDFCRLPRAYHGLVRTSALRAVRERCGRAFPGPSPDMSSAIALAITLERVYCVGLPLVLSGKGMKSTGGWGAAKTHEGRLEEIQHLPQWSVANWSELVPRFFGGITIWAEDVVSACRALSCPSALYGFNEERLLAQCLLFHPAQWREVLVVFRRSPGNSEAGLRLVRIARCFLEYVRGWSERLQSLMVRLQFGRRGRRLTRRTGIENVDAAVCTFELVSRELGYAWERVEDRLRNGQQRVLALVDREPF